MEKFERIRDAIAFLRKEVGLELGLQFLIIFLEIAAREKITHNELKQLTGIGEGTIQRNVNIVDDRYKLIEQVPVSGSEELKWCRLNAHGKQVAEKLVNIVYA